MENIPNHCCRVLKASGCIDQSSELTCFVKASAFCNLGSERETQTAFRSKLSSDPSSSTCNASHIKVMSPLPLRKMRATFSLSVSHHIVVGNVIQSSFLQHTRVFSNALISLYVDDCDTS
jgi:hypothetical protein